MMKVLYEDNHLLVVEKPPNIPVQQDSSKDKDLLSILKDRLKERYGKPGNVYLGLVHRLDRPVGGVMLFARTSKAAGRLSQQIQSDVWEKTYHCVVEAEVDPLRGTLQDYLLKDHKANRVSVTDELHGKMSVLEYEAVDSINGLTLLKIKLITGRSHQIRVQLSSRNWPIWGDQRYNPQAKAGQQIALWATALSIQHPTTKEKLTFHSFPAPSYPWNEFRSSPWILNSGEESYDQKKKEKKI